jgi:small subunit ribosomal protein S6
MYDGIIFLKPTLSEAEVNTCINKIKNLIAEAKGEIVEERQPNKKRLPFKVKKTREAYHVFMKFGLDASKANELNAKIRLIEDINRFTLALAGTTVREPEKPKKKKETVVEKKEEGGVTTTTTTTTTTAPAAPAPAPATPSTDTSETAPKEA